MGTAEARALLDAAVVARVLAAAGELHRSAAWDALEPILQVLANLCRDGAWPYRPLAGAVLDSREAACAEDGRAVLAGHSVVPLVVRAVREGVPGVRQQALRLLGNVLVDDGELGPHAW
jgi:hypothetical protein